MRFRPGDFNIHAGTSPIGQSPCLLDESLSAAVTKLEPSRLSSWYFEHQSPAALLRATGVLTHCLRKITIAGTLNLGRFRLETADSRLGWPPGGTRLVALNLDRCLRPWCPPISASKKLGKHKQPSSYGRVYGEILGRLGGRPEPRIVQERRPRRWEYSDRFFLHCWGHRQIMHAQF